MMNRSIKNIIIVGGGTSGWLTACSLYRSVPFAKITLIDKEVSESVGVGEATLLNFKFFLEKFCGFSQQKIIKCFQYCEAIRKIGILFPDWGYDGNIIWHPFQFVSILEKENNHNPSLLDAWSHFQDYDIKHILPPYKKLNKIDWKNSRFAEHINSLKLVKYLKRHLVDKVNYVQSGVKNIERDDNGISSLTLEDGSVISADLYVDCTGFKSILKDIRDKIDLSDRLYVNTALAGHIPYTNRKEQFKPYVSCPVVDSGWIWEIPLQSRIGSGIVFNRDITSPEEAKQEFYDHWNQEVDLKLIDWSPYYDKNQWDKNVVSIGLSAGFIEPLESTGIELIIQGAMKLCSTIQGGYYTEQLSNHYNSLMCLQFEQCVDVVNMHYSLSTKDTPFWNYVRSNYKESDTLKFYKDNMLNSNEPTMVSASDDFVFGGNNWIHWMVQLGYLLVEKDYIIGNYKQRNRIVTKDNLHDIMIHESNWIQRKQYCNCSICDGARLNG